MSKESELIYFDAEEMRRFLVDALVASRVEKEVAKSTAENLLLASLRGTDSHGVRLLPHYLEGVKGGRINPDPQFKIERRAASCSLLDAGDSFGAAAGFAAIDEAIRLARESGSGFVAVSNSSHCGALAQFALKAAKEDMVGLAFTQATPKVRNPNGVRPFFGTNPLCVAAPMAAEEPFCFDSAPTPFSNNKVKEFREQGKELPGGVAADSEGIETLDPGLATQLLRIGDYKGFGLSMVVDMFCSLFSGMGMGDEVSTMYGNSMSEKRKLGQFYGAYSIEAFESPDVFKNRLQGIADRIRMEPRRDPDTPVLVPGDPEKAEMAIRLKSGIPLTRAFHIEFDRIAVELNIELSVTIPVEGAD